jgi:hypothetical protein
VFVVVGLVSIIYSDAIWAYGIAVSLMASAGTFWPVLWAMLGRAYGRRHYNVIRGTMYGTIMTATAGVPWLGGIIFTRTGGYALMLWVLLGVSLAGIVGFLVAIAMRPGKRRVQA